MTAAGVVPAHSPRGLLRHRDFRLLWIGQTTSRLGSSVTSVALPLVAVATLDASTFEVALLSAAAWLPWLLVGLPVGALVDRLPRRPVLIACDLANPDFVKYAESFGAAGRRARGPDELRVALRESISRREPTLIEVPVGAMPSPWEFIFMPRVRGT